MQRNGLDAKMDIDRHRSAGHHAAGQRTEPLSERHSDARAAPPRHEPAATVDQYFEEYFFEWTAPGAP